MSEVTRPTLESMAAALGVSRQTISNAINRPEVLAPETLERVQAGIQEFGYVPSRAAQQLRTARSRTIAFRIMPEFDGINGHILAVFLHELVEQARRRGYHLAVFAATDWANEIENYRAMHASGEVDGVILTSTHAGDRRPAWLTKEGLPFVTFGRPWTDDDDEVGYDWVDVDGAAGVRAVAEVLKGRGHTRIGYVAGPEEPGVMSDRFRGWREAVPEYPELFQHCSDTSSEGMRAALDLLERGATALVCASDTVAIGAFAALSSVFGSEDVSRRVVGFDDTPTARAIGLSSVAQPIAEAAATALRLLVTRLTDAGDPRHVLLAPVPMFRNHEVATFISEQSLHQRKES